MATFLDDLPDPSKFENKTATNQETGEVYVSDGEKWSKVTAQQVGGEGFPAPQTGPSKLQQMGRGALSMASLLPAMAINPTSPGLVLLKRVLESVGPMAMETIIQRQGLAPESGSDIAASGLMSPLTRAFLGTPSVAKSAVRGGIGFVAPAEVRQQGGEIARNMLKGAESAPLYEAAAKGGPLNTAPLIKTVSAALRAEEKMSTPDRVATGLLKNLQTKLIGKSVPGGKIDYPELIRETQRLRQRAQSFLDRGKSDTAATLFEARAKILNEMDNISPAIKLANSAYRREESVKQIAYALRKSNAGNSIRDLFDKDPLVSGIFSDPEKRQLFGIADSITRIGTGSTMGAANRFIQAMTEPIAEALQGPTGRALIDIVMRNPRDPQFIPRLAAVIAAEGGRSAFGRIGETSKGQEIQQQLNQLMGRQGQQP